MDKEYINNQIVDMYCKGYSIKSIADYFFSYVNRHVPKNENFKNLYVIHKKEFNRSYCDTYVISTILNYDRNRKYIV